MVTSHHSLHVIYGMTNSYRKTIEPISSASGRNFLYKRDQLIPWSEFNLNFSPQLGQSVRMRETYKLTVLWNGKETVYTNNKRFLQTTNIGHWQHLYVDFDDEYYIERSGQMDAHLSADGLPLYSFVTSYDWTYNIYRDYKDFFGAIFGTIDPCNADLRPAAVPNTFIDTTNVLDYVRISAKIAGADFSGVIDDILELTSPTIAGFRFGDGKNVFTTMQQSIVVDLEAYSVPTAIGDLGIYLNPGYNIVGCEHTIEARELGRVEKFTNQLEPVTCLYLPGIELDFPTSTAQNQCEIALTAQVSAGNFYYSEQAAIDALAAPGTILSGSPLQTTFLCPDGTTYPNPVWIINSR